MIPFSFSLEEIIVFCCVDSIWPNKQEKKEEEEEEGQWCTELYLATITAATRNQIVVANVDIRWNPQFGSDIVNIPNDNIIQKKKKNIINNIFIINESTQPVRNSNYINELCNINTNIKINKNSIKA